MDWQPIETAPKDGTPFLAFAQTTPSGNVRAPSKHITVAYHTRWAGWVSIDGHYGVRPTHWMPLPPPPSSNASA